MRLIAHRGNTGGPNTDTENTCAEVDLAIEKGFDAEIDVWIFDGEIFLGHDTPSLKIKKKWINERRNQLWVHCKNAGALEYFCRKEFNYFFHDTDAYTITSKGFVWAYPGMPPAGKKCIAVMPEYVSALDEYVFDNYFGVCSDYVSRLKELPL